MTARRGDHLLVPFRCDQCVIRGLRRVSPGTLGGHHHLKEPDLKMAVRRVILDSFWSRESSTVRSNETVVRRAINDSLSLGFRPPFPPRGPLPDNVDDVAIAILSVQASLRPGRYKDYTQYDTIRGLRSAYGNLARSSAGAVVENWTLAGEDGRASRLSKLATDSLWYGRFSAGCRKRMGQDIRPNMAVSTDVMLALQEEVRRRAKVADDDIERTKWIVFGTYAVVSYVASLRGQEGRMLDLHGLRTHALEGRTGWKDQSGPLDSWITLPLLGRFKGEEGERYHLVYVVSRTKSGLEPRWWLENLILAKRQQNLVRGPAISDHEGFVVESGALNEQFHDVLRTIQADKPDLISSNLDVGEEFGTARSFRRGANSQALNANVSKGDRDHMNRWRTTETAKGRDPNRPMRDRYADPKLASQPTLRFSWAM